MDWEEIQDIISNIDLNKAAWTSWPDGIDMRCLCDIKSGIPND